MFNVARLFILWHLRFAEAVHFEIIHRYRFGAVGRHSKLMSGWETAAKWSKGKHETAASLYKF
jgi:hypothetical protein